jgi:hypothetical protein
MQYVLHDGVALTTASIIVFESRKEHIVAIHSHMTHENPRIPLFHYGAAEM